MGVLGVRSPSAPGAYGQARRMGFRGCPPFAPVPSGANTFPARPPFSPWEEGDAAGLIGQAAAIGRGQRIIETILLGG